jgi:outer membrane protein TolC
MDNDLLKIKLQLTSVKLKQIEFNNSVQLAAINMNNLLSRPIDTAIEPATELKYSNDKIEPLSAYLEKAKAGRPELKSAQARISAAKEGIAVSRSKHFPQMYLTGNYVNAKPNQRIFPAVDEYKDTWDIGVSLTLDIWSWGRINSQVNQSKLQAAQLQDAVRQIEDNVVMEVAQNYFNVISGKEKIAIAEQNISLAEDNFRITKNKFNQGLSLNSELLDAEISLLNAKTDYTQALVDYELAKAKLLKSTGE